MILTIAEKPELAEIIAKAFGGEVKKVVIGNAQITTLLLGVMVICWYLHLLIKLTLLIKHGLCQICRWI